MIRNAACGLAALIALVGCEGPKAPAELTAAAPARVAVAPPPPPPPVFPVGVPVGPVLDYNLPPEPAVAYPAFEPNPVTAVAEAPVSTFSVDVDTASYSRARASLERGVLPGAQAIRVEEMVNYFPYDYAPPAGLEQPFSVDVAVFPTPWNAGTQLMRIGLQGYEPPAANRPPLSLVFLLDTSGSMAAPDKMPLLKASFRLLLDQLGAQDTVGIVAYAGSAGVVLEPTPATERRTILAALDRLRAGGSTAGGAGLALAYDLAAEARREGSIGRVILATDGDFNVGPQTPDALETLVEERRDEGVFLNVLGFGTSGSDDAVMQALAQNGNGQAAFIDTLTEARKVLVEQAGGALIPIAKDVKVQVEFNPARIAEYRLIGYETRALNREDFNDDKVDAGEIGAGLQVTALYEVTPVGSDAIRIDPLRYATVIPAPASATDELAFVRLRWKRPDGDVSRLIERPVTDADVLASPDDEARFAAAVAGFGQLLQGGRYTGEFGYDAAADLARGAKGEDPYGYRAEAVRLMKLAGSLAE